MMLARAYLARLKEIFTVLKDCRAQYRTPEPKKPLLRQVKELYRLTRHWKCIPQPYYEYRMFLRGCSLTPAEMQDYLPMAVFWKLYQSSHIPADYSILCTDKALFADLMSHYGFPQPKTILKYNRGRFYDAASRLLTEAAADSLISRQTFPRLFLKDTLGRCGVDIFPFDADGTGRFTHGQDTLSARLIRTKCGQHPFFLQEGVVQCASLNAVHPSSVNTVRIITKYTPGAPRFISAGIRFGRDGIAVDNSHLGGLFVHVDVETGRLGAEGRIANDTKIYTAHPNSGIKFAGFQVERWPEVKQAVSEACHAFHEITFIGWDVAILPDGVMILEMNAYPGLYFPQLASGGLAVKICG